MPYMNSVSKFMETNPNASSLLRRRFAMAQHPLGRFWLELHVHQQRIRAFWLKHGSDVSKRTFDMLVALLLLLAFAPLFVVIALLVKLEDGGPVLFPQTRVGRYGRLFTMYKIRSMCL